jgi:hypothetical protein
LANNCSVDGCVRSDERQSCQCEGGMFRLLTIHNSPSNSDAITEAPKKQKSIIEAEMKMPVNKLYNARV